MKKKTSKKVFLTLLGGLATIMAFVAMPLATTAAGNQESIKVYHHHTEACNGTVYVEQSCDGTSWLRTVATDTCTLCGAYHDYYQYDGSCSCGKTWYRTGHACINSPEGSNHGTCTNYSKIDCETIHSHPTTEIVCGKTENSVIGTITVSKSITTPAQKVQLYAEASGSMENVSFKWQGNTTGKQFSVTENGTYKLYVSYTEGGVNYVQEMSVNVDNVDNVAPYIVNLFADITTPVAGSVQIRVDAGDNRGLPTKYVSWNGGEYTSESVLEVFENGVYQVQIRDLANNISSMEIMINNIDNEKPIIHHIDVSTTEYTSDAVVLAVEADDNRPWPNEYISWNDGEYTSDRHFEADENGTYTVRVRDAAGNCAEESIHIRNIDREAPEIRELKADVTTPTAGDVTLSIKAVDNTEMPDKCISWNLGSYTSAATYKVSANGTYKVRVKDMAGNITEKSIVINNIDKTAPVINSLEADNEKPTSGNVVLRVEAEDKGGFPEKYIIWNGGTPTNKKIFEVDRNGTYEVSVIDKAGNRATEKIKIDNIDKIAPVIHSLEMIPKLWYSGECTVHVTANDGKDKTSAYMVSGLHNKAYSWDGGKTWTSDSDFVVMEEGEVTVYVRDQVGNIVKGSIDVKKTLLPSISDDEDDETKDNEEDESDNSENDSSETEDSENDNSESNSSETEDSESDNSESNSGETEDSESDNSESDSSENKDDESDNRESNSSNKEDNESNNSGIDDNLKEDDKNESEGNGGSNISSHGNSGKTDNNVISDDDRIDEKIEEGFFAIESVEKEEDEFWVEEIPEEAETIEQKDSRAFRSFGKILIAILGCLGFLFFGFILFVFLGMCRVYCVSDKLKEIYLGSVGLVFYKGGFRIRIGNSILEEAESRDIRVKIPGWFVKIFAYKPLQISAADEIFEKYVEQEVDFHVNA